MIQDNQQMLRKKDDLNRKRCSPVLLELLLVYILSSFLQIKQQTYFTIFNNCDSSSTSYNSSFNTMPSERYCRFSS